MIFLSRLLKRNTTVLTGAFVLASALRLVSNMILTRLLYPEAFGLIAVAMSVLFIIELSSDVGFVAFVVRHKDGESEEFLDTIWTLRLLRGLILFPVLAVTAYPISLLYEADQVFFILLALSSIFLIRGLESPTIIVAQRRHEVAKISFIDIFSQVIAMIISITLAVIVREYWALVVGILFRETIRTILSYVLFKRSIRKFALDWDLIREFWAFGRVIMLSSIITIIVTQYDKILFMKWYGASFTGIYSLALVFGDSFRTLFQTFAARIVYPKCAEAYRNDPETVTEVLYSVSQKFTIFFLFAVAIATVMSQSIIDILYDARYQRAGAFLFILLIRATLLGLNTISNSALVSIGFVRMTLMGNVIRIVWVGVSLYPVYVYSDPEGLVWSLVIMEGLVFIYYYFQMRRQGILLWREESVRLFAIVAGLFVGYGMEKIINMSNLL